MSSSARGSWRGVWLICFGVMWLAASAAQAGTVELLVDPHFTRGLDVFAPDTVPQVVTDQLQWDPAQGAPEWTLAQWGTDFDLTGASGTMLPSGSSRFEVTSKWAVVGPPVSSDADLILGVDAWEEYGGEQREAGEPWPALPAGQRISYPDFAGPGCPWLHELTELRYHVEARLLMGERYDVPGYDPSKHTAHYLIHFTIQNLNQASPGYGDYLFLGCNLYDERWEMPPAHMAEDSGTGKYIYTPATAVYTSETMHGGDWVTFDVDLLPLAKAALQKAWDEGFLTGSQDIGDYRIGGTTAGWEVPGLSKASVQVRNFSITAAGPLVGTVRDWGDADAWPRRAVPASTDMVVLFDDRKVTGSESCDALRGPGWAGRSCTLYIEPGGELNVSEACLLGIGEGVVGSLRLEGGTYAGGGGLHVGRPYGEIAAGHGVLFVGPGSELRLPSQQVWIGTVGGTGDFVVEGGGSTIDLEMLRFDGEAGLGAQRLEIRPSANGAEGLSVIETANLIWPDHATLVVAPSYCPAVGDSWEVLRWSNSPIAGDSGTAEFNAVEVPDGLVVDIDYGSAVAKRITVTVTASGCPHGSYHSADTDEDESISVSELLRVLQFHNAGSYHCAANETDGYGPGEGGQGCDQHDSDYLDPAWSVGLTEVLRLVQLHQFGGYRYCGEESEDGFCGPEQLASR